MNDRELIEQLLPLDEGPGPARPLGPEQIDAAVASAMHAAALPPSPPPAKPPTPWTSLLPAAAVGLAGVAWLFWPQARPTAAPAAPVAAVAPIPVVAPVAPIETIVAPDDRIDPSEEIAPEEIAPEEAAPEGTTARRTESADDLLARANALRVERRWREASATYDAVIARAPSSRAAYVARISGAAIALEQLHAPRRALVLYRAAAAEDGDLDPQAEHGLARALRALGDDAGERAALHRLLEAHPASPLSGVARQRLDELEASTPSETP